jgi:hypothetical protein
MVRYARNAINIQSEIGVTTVFQCDGGDFYFLTVFVVNGETMCARANGGKNGVEKYRIGREGKLVGSIGSCYISSA